MRIGSGFDAHRFDPSRRLVIGGVEIPDHPGLSGHSDADVLCHAIADALLGAASLGDLGERFPDSERWRDASSLEILKETSALVRAAGWTIGNVDATVVAERPRLEPHKQAMTENVAGALGIGSSAVSVKATSTDRLGFAGREEGMAAFAIVLLEPVKPLEPTPGAGESS